VVEKAEENGKPSEFGCWINEPEVIRFQAVRLEMNSLRRKRDDIIRQSINEPGTRPVLVSAFGSPGFVAAGLQNLINDWRFLNRS
jgi:hypothetical protein